MTRRLVVVGGGIAGLTTAFNVMERVPAVEIIVLEASEQVGGNIRTDRVDGYTVERGPNGYLDNAPKTVELVERLGLLEELQPADETAAKRFLFRNGRLHALPTGPLSFLGCGVLSVPGRLRVLMEPLAKSRPEGVDETVFDFASRRIGPEAAAVLVDSMVSGVFAGDARELSLQSTFPKMAAMEAEHGGLVKAMVAKMKMRRQAKNRGETLAVGGPAGPAGHLTSFRSGLDTLPKRLAEKLGERVRLACPVSAVWRDGRKWRIRSGSSRELEADAVVVALPSPKAAPLLMGLDGGLADAVSQMKTAGLAVVAAVFDAASIGGAPGGFGFLVPRLENKRMLGCLWDSSIFPGRAPAGKVLLRVMIGGAHDPELLELDDGEILATVRRELSETMGLTVDPEWTRLYRYPLGIGQYRVGHQALLDRMHSALEAMPGMWLAGSSYYGVAMNACIEKAEAQAEEIVKFFRAE